MDGATEERTRKLLPGLIGREHRLRTLSPIWTGGISRDCSVHAKPSGLMGSLRYWAEQVCRTEGRSVCDGKTWCGELDANKCAVCAIFGSTERSRRFRLEVSGLRLDENAGGLVHEEEKGFLVRFWARRERDLDPVALQPAALELPHKALAMIVAHGGLGARTQRGYGQVEFAQPSSAAAFDTSRWRCSEEFEIDRPAPTQFKEALDLARKVRAEIRISIGSFPGLNAAQILGRMKNPPRGEFGDSFASPLEVGVRALPGHARPTIRLWCISASVSAAQLREVVAETKRRLRNT
jgi:CRISPR type III-B/RAMP module RAMP protein Cmr1